MVHASISKRGAYGVMVIIVGNSRFQTLDEAVCISHSVNTYRKDVNQTILPPANGK